MNAHAIGWRQIQDAEKLAKRALEVFPDEAQPATDRSRLREQWVAAVRALGRKWILAEPVARKAAA